MSVKVLVLLSTYNGDNYLSTQIDSILNQQGVDVSLMVRDDGSSDGTISILNDYSATNDKVSYYKGNNIGPCQSFFDLLKKANGFDYYAFSDQDDVWDNDKLARAIDKLQQLDSTKPALYCSNLRVVDKDLNFCRLANDNCFDTKKRYSALVDFYAVGCTEVFNQVAADLTRTHVRPDCIMHDSWIFMICNFFGNVVYDSIAHINYRQHNNNVVGTMTNKCGKLIARLKRVMDRTVQPRLKNAQLILSEFESELSERDLRKVKKVAYYKKSLGNWLRLLLDCDIKSNHLNSDLRYRLLILIRGI